MSEFNNRLKAQREALAIVNAVPGLVEELCSLTEASIARWTASNHVGRDDGLPMLLQKIGDSLAFLATKSQEQITDDYKAKCLHIAGLTDELRRITRTWRSSPLIPAITPTMRIVTN